MSIITEDGDVSRIIQSEGKTVLDSSVLMH